MSCATQWICESIGCSGREGELSWLCEEGQQLTEVLHLFLFMPRIKKSWPNCTIYFQKLIILLLLCLCQSDLGFVLTLRSSYGLPEVVLDWPGYMEKVSGIDVARVYGKT